jgi:ribonuclease BN (tRNA processing enzyme)
MEPEIVYGDEKTVATKAELQFIGTGSAFCLENWQSNALLTVEADNGEIHTLLIDCGGDARHALREAGFSHLDVDAVYVSHVHADHVGGIEWLAFTRYFDPRSTDRPYAIGNHRVLSDLWFNTLRGGLSSLEGQEPCLDTYFVDLSLADNQQFVFNGLVIEPLRVVHIMNNRELMPSYGLMMYMPGGQRVFFTTDAQHAPKQIAHFYDRADIIFHDCETLYLRDDDGIPNFETPIQSGVHAHLEELCTLPQDTRTKMWLYHYQDGTMSGPIEDRAFAQGFQGFVAKGQTFEWPN